MGVILYSLSQLKTNKNIVFQNPKGHVSPIKFSFQAINNVELFFIKSLILMDTAKSNINIIKFPKNFFQKKFKNYCLTQHDIISFEANERIL